MAEGFVTQPVVTNVSDSLVGTPPAQAQTAYAQGLEASAHADVNTIESAAGTPAVLKDKGRTAEQGTAADGASATAASHQYGAMGIDDDASPTTTGPTSSVSTGPRPLPPVPVKSADGVQPSANDALVKSMRYWQPSEEQMATLARLERELVWVPDDGNCFFHALTTVVHARFSPDELKERAPKFPLPGSGDHVQQIREGLANFLRSEEWGAWGAFFAADAGYADEVPDMSHGSEFHRDIVAAVGRSGSWNGLFGDVLPQLINHAFGDLDFGVVHYVGGQPVVGLSESKNQLVLVHRNGLAHYWATRDVLSPAAGPLTSPAVGAGGTKELSGSGRSDNVFDSPRELMVPSVSQDGAAVPDRTATDTEMNQLQQTVRATTSPTRPRQLPPVPTTNTKASTTTGPTGSRQLPPVPTMDTQPELAGQGGLRPPGQAMGEPPTGALEEQREEHRDVAAADAGVDRNRPLTAPAPPALLAPSTSTRSTTGARSDVYAMRQDASWESKTRRVLQGALLNALADGKIGTPYMAGLVKALDASRISGPVGGAGLVRGPQPTSFPGTDDLIVRMSHIAEGSSVHESGVPAARESEPVHPEPLAHQRSAPRVAEAGAGPVHSEVSLDADVTEHLATGARQSAPTVDATRLTSDNTIVSAVGTPEAVDVWMNSTDDLMVDGLLSRLRVPGVVSSSEQRRALLGSLATYVDRMTPAQWKEYDELRSTPLQTTHPTTGRTGIRRLPSLPEPTAAQTRPSAHEDTAAVDSESITVATQGAASWVGLVDGVPIPRSASPEQESQTGWHQSAPTVDATQPASDSTIEPASGTPEAVRNTAAHAEPGELGVPLPASGSGVGSSRRPSAEETRSDARLARSNARAGAGGVVGPRVPQRGRATADPSQATSQPVTGVTRQAGIEKPATWPKERVPAPARGAGVDPAALRDVDVVNSWLSVSTVAGRPRSEAVRPVDDAVQAWKGRGSGGRDLNRGLLASIIDSIGAWKRSPDGSVRGEAVERLLAHAQAHLDRLNERRLPQTTPVRPRQSPAPGNTSVVDVWMNSTDDLMINGLLSRLRNPDVVPFPEQRQALLGSLATYMNRMTPAQWKEYDELRSTLPLGGSPLSGAVGHTPVATDHTGFQASTSVAHSLIDPGADHQYDAIGIEADTSASIPAAAVGAMSDERGRVAGWTDDETAGLDSVEAGSATSRTSANAEDLAVTAGEGEGRTEQQSVTPSQQAIEEQMTASESEASDGLPGFAQLMGELPARGHVTVATDAESVTERRTPDGTVPHSAPAEDQAVVIDRSAHDVVDALPSGLVETRSADPTVAGSSRQPTGVADTDRGDSSTSSPGEAEVLLPGLTDEAVKDAIAILRAERFKFPLTIGTSESDQQPRRISEFVIRAVAEIVEAQGRRQAVLFARAYTSRIYELFPGLRNVDSRPGGAGGVEIETSVGLRRGDSNQEVPTHLFDHGLVSVDGDTALNGDDIVELVSAPIGHLDDEIRPDADLVFELLSVMIEDFEGNPGRLLREVFSVEDFTYLSEEAADDVFIGEKMENPWWVQYTTGIPIHGLADFHEWAVSASSRQLSYEMEAARRAADDFARAVTSVFAGVHASQIDTLRDDYAAWSLFGYAKVILYPHVAASLKMEISGVVNANYGVPQSMGLVKQTLDIVSRTSLRGVLAGLPPEVREFLGERRDWILGKFEDTFTRSNRSLVDDFLSSVDVEHQSILDVLMSYPSVEMDIEASHSDYLDNGLIDQPDVLLSQEVLGIRTNFLELDSGAEGELPVPLVVLEERAPLDQEQSVEGVRNSWERRRLLARETYGSAVAAEMAYVASETLSRPAWSAEAGGESVVPALSDEDASFDWTFPDVSDHDLQEWQSGFAGVSGEIERLLSISPAKMFAARDAARVVMNVYHRPLPQGSENTSEDEQNYILLYESIQDYAAYIIFTSRNPAEAWNVLDEEMRTIGQTFGTAAGLWSEPVPSTDAPSAAAPGAWTSPAAPPVHASAAAAETTYARSIAGFLNAPQVNVSGLLALLRRRGSSPELFTPTFLQTLYQQTTGVPLMTAVNNAVQQGRLAVEDHQEVLRGLGLVSGFAFADEPLRNMAAVPGDDVSLLPEVGEYANNVYAALRAGDPERALSLLLALERDMRKVWAVEAAWQRSYGSHLGQVMVAAWPAYANRINHALGLADAGPVPMQQVHAWYRQLFQSTFEHDQHGSVPVTAEYPEDGCVLRAHLWAIQLMRWGAMPRKVFAALAHEQRGLSFTTSTARGATQTAPRQVDWSFHVGPVVNALRADGTVVPMVLDLALHRGPLTLLQWAEAIGMPTGPGSYYYDEGSLAQVHSRLVVDQQRHPNAWRFTERMLPRRPTLLFTDGYCLDFPHPDRPHTESWQEADALVQRDGDRLYRHHVRAVRRKLARKLYDMLNGVRAPYSRAALLRQLRSEVDRYAPQPGFLEGNRELADAARFLLTDDYFGAFARLFPRLTDPSLHPDSSSDEAELSSGEEDNSSEEQASAGRHGWRQPASWTAPATISEVAEGDEGVAAGGSAGVADSWAGLRELAEPAVIDTERFDPRRSGSYEPGRLAGAMSRIRLDARRFQDVGGGWISDATVRVHLASEPGVTGDDIRFLAERMTSAVQRVINAPRFELPDGSVFHFNVEFLANRAGAHHVMRVHAEPGATTTTDVHLVAAGGSPLSEHQLLHELLHFVGLPDRYFASGFLFRDRPWSRAVAFDGSLMAGEPNSEDGPVLSADDLAAIGEVFRSGPEIRELPHPLAGRDLSAPPLDGESAAEDNPQASPVQASVARVSQDKGKAPERETGAAGPAVLHEAPTREEALQAFSDAQREVDGAIDALADAQASRADGVESAAHAGGAAVLAAWQEVLASDAVLEAAEADWDAATGGEPLPAVELVAEPRAAMPGASGRIRRWLGPARHVEPEPSMAPPGEVISVEPMPLAAPASGRSVSGESASPSGAVQMMVPSARDLLLAQQLRDNDPRRSEEAFRVESQRIHNELNPASHGGHHSQEMQRTLNRRLAALSEEQALLAAMLPRGVWQSLRAPQIAAMVMAERRGRQAVHADRVALIEQLRSDRWRWTAAYPLDDQRINGLIDTVHAYLRQMPLTVNVELGLEAADGHTLLDILTSTSGVVLRNVWETQPDKHKYLRGQAEESLGYAGTVRRSTAAGGIYADPAPRRRLAIPFQRPPEPAPTPAFIPRSEDRALLPKYAALTSPLRQTGVTTYGSAVFHLSPAMRNRATFTPADSFAPGLRGAAGVTGPNHLLPLLVHGNEELVRLAFAEATEFAYDPEYRTRRDTVGFRMDGFFEAQIHGDVMWSHITRIVLTHTPEDRDQAVVRREHLQAFAAANRLTFTVELFDITRPAPSAAALGGWTSPAAPPVHASAAAAEATYARSIAEFLNAPQVNVPGLLALLRRRASSPELLTPTFLQTLYQQTTGVPLMTAVNNAVRQGRLAVQDHQEVLRGLVSGFAFADEPLRNMAAALTAPVRGRETFEVPFEQGVKDELPVAGQDALDDVVGRMVWASVRNWQQGLPLPKVKVTGYGNGRFGRGGVTAEHTAASRAATVANELGTRIGAFLRGQEGSKPAVDDFDIDRVAGERQAGMSADDRRRVTVVVDYDQPQIVLGGSGERPVEVAKNLHFVWLGGAMSDAARRNLDAWSAEAGRSRWSVHLWTDQGARRANAGYFARLSGAGWHIHGSHKELFSSGDITARTVIDTAMANRAFAMASNVIRYGALRRFGGVYLDVDIAPGGVRLPAKPLMMDPAGLPFFAPSVRDRVHLEFVLGRIEAQARDMGVPAPPRDDASLTRAIAYQYGKGDLNNNLIVAPAGSEFISDLLVNLKKPGSPGFPAQMEEMRQNSPQLSGPNFIKKRLEQSLRDRGQWPSQSEHNGFGGRVPYATAFEQHYLTFDPAQRAIWQGLQLLTDESENQEHLHSAPRSHAFTPEAAQSTEMGSGAEQSFRWGAPASWPVLETIPDAEEGHEGLLPGEPAALASAPWRELRELAEPAVIDTERFDPRRSGSYEPGRLAGA
ncbi:protein-glutamine glutaminase family protein, partial [Streptomyces broussonetiae]|uniref:protein-glutamine glutaminase family protein n=1 Tax=Streptomyces broussonetiae TaxID=2686304 RepID=UPI0035DA72B7